MSRLKIILFIVSALLISSCYQPKPPVFKRIEEIQVIPEGVDRFKLKGQAVYQNQEKTSGELVGIHCDLYINNVYVTRIDQILDQHVNAYDEVIVPFEISLDAGQIFGGSGSFKNVLQSLVEQKVNVKYDGHVTMKISGIDWDLPLEHTEQIHLDFPF